MKQLVLMSVLTAMGTVGVYFNTFWGVAIYYLFAVLRPQALWKWVLPEGVSWSYYVAITTILAACLMSLAVPPLRPRRAGRALRTAFTAHPWVLAFGVWIAVTYLTAQNREAAYPWFIEYLKIFVMFAASTVLLRTVGQVWSLMVIAASALGYIAYEVNYLYFVQGYLGIYHNGYGGLDNNGAGIMLAMGVPLCFFVWEGSQRAWRWLYLSLVPVLLHAVLMTYSRGAMVSLLAAMPFVFWRSRRKRQMALVMLLLAAIALPKMAGKEIVSRFFTIRNYEADGSAQSRLASWKAAWQIATEHPILGVGVRNSSLLTYDYGADMVGRVIHNQYLQVAADSGLVGLALYLAALLAVWLATLRARRAVARRDDVEASQVHAVASGVESSMAIFCVGAVFLSLEVFELPYLLLLLGSHLPLVASIGSRRDAQVSRPLPLLVEPWHTARAAGRVWGGRG